MSVWNQTAGPMFWLWWSPGKTGTRSGPQTVPECWTRWGDFPCECGADQRWRSACLLGQTTNSHTTLAGRGPSHQGAPGEHWVQCFWPDESAAPLSAPTLPSAFCSGLRTRSGKRLNYTLQNTQRLQVCNMQSGCTLDDRRCTQKLRLKWYVCFLNSHDCPTVRRMVALCWHAEQHTHTRSSRNYGNSQLQCRLSCRLTEQSSVMEALAR